VSARTLQSFGAAITGEDRLAREIREMAPWFHNLHLPEGRQTAPDHPLGDFPACKWAQLAAALPRDLRGWRVLDIGCNAGFYSLALAGRGARVLAIDIDEHYLRQAAWARERFGFGEQQIELRRLGVYELGKLKARFDLVLFLGVLYHLRHPQLALDLVAERVGRLLALQTLTMPGESELEVPDDLPIDEREAMREEGWPKLALIEHRLAGDPTNWWAPNAAAVAAMLRIAGLEPISRPGHELWLARPAAAAARRGPRPPLPSRGDSGSFSGLLEQ
jgi:tRNA (mo5U34)-methyltransferase